MKTILRNILAVIIGLFIGGTVNMLIVMIGPSIIPPPEGVDMTQAQSLSESVHLLRPQHFLFPFLAHALGTLSGAIVAILISASCRSVFAYVIGVFFLAGGIAAALMITAPVWFVIVDLGFAYIPMSWVAVYWTLRREERARSNQLSAN